MNVRQIWYTRGGVQLTGVDFETYITHVKLKQQQNHFIRKNWICFVNYHVIYGLRISNSRFVGIILLDIFII